MTSARVSPVSIGRWPSGRVPDGACRHSPVDSCTAQGCRTRIARSSFRSRGQRPWLRRRVFCEWTSSTRVEGHAALFDPPDWPPSPMARRSAPLCPWPITVMWGPEGLQKVVLTPPTNGSCHRKSWYRPASTGTRPSDASATWRPRRRGPEKHADSCRCPVNRSPGGASRSLGDCRRCVDRFRGSRRREQVMVGTVAEVVISMLNLHRSPGRGPWAWASYAGRHPSTAAEFEVAGVVVDISDTDLRAVGERVARRDRPITFPPAVPCGPTP